MNRFCVAALFAFSFAVPAHATVPQKAQAAYFEGQFVRAASLAEADGSGEALAFAARARIADAIMRDGVFCLPCLTIAETIAQTAIERDPNNAEGYTQLAIAMGFRGRLIDVMEARAEELPDKGHAAIEKALAIDPNNPWAQAALGAWHLEVVHRAGPILADVTYGARRSDGLKAYRAALTAIPGDLILHFHFALSILALDGDEFRTEALTALQNGAKDARADALTTFTRKRADMLTEALKTGTTEEVEDLVRKFQGYPPDSQ